MQLRTGEFLHASLLIQAKKKESARIQYMQKNFTMGIFFFFVAKLENLIVFF